jgi:5-methylcytosine-specific restriction endonuclease McrBC GTP-binding regulatory subunit McrB
LEDHDVRNKLLPAEGETPFCSRNDFIKAVKISSDVSAYIEKIHAILHSFNLHFGYRVINEISSFICHAKVSVHDFNFEEVMDIQMVQKILPKFHGTQAKLEEPLGRLLAFCNNGEKLPDESYLEKAAAYDKEATFPRSAQKLARMIQILKNQGYTSFIE